ncbi:MAG: hypothetical protein ACR2KM_04895 [Gemmatimonadaceae bacterium]
MNSIGTNVHLSYLGGVYGTGFSTIVLPRLHELGIRHVRDGARVVSDDSWMQLVFGRVASVANLGIRFDFIGMPAQGDTNYSQVNQFDRLLRFLNPAYVESFEGLNEHDFSGRTAWASETRTFQAALYARVHGNAQLAGIPVLGPSLARPANSSTVGDLSAYMDFGVMHSYAGGRVPMATFTYNVTGLQPMNAARMVWATETGYHTALLDTTTGHPGVSEAAMAKYVPRLFLQYFNAGVPRTFSYELIDEGANQADKETKFGLLHLDGTAKPAYSALKNLIGLLADPGPAFSPGGVAYTLSGDTTNVQRMLFRKRDGRFYLVVWQEVTSYDPTRKVDVVVPDRQLTLLLSQPVSQAHVYVPLQSASPVSQASSIASLALSVPDHPLVVELVP